MRGGGEKLSSRARDQAAVFDLRHVRSRYCLLVWSKANCAGQPTKHLTLARERSHEINKPTSNVSNNQTKTIKQEGKHEPHSIDKSFVISNARRYRQQKRPTNKNQEQKSKILESTTPMHSIIAQQQKYAPQTIGPKTFNKSEHSFN